MAPRAERSGSHRIRDERGNALIEFVVLAVVLLVPTGYLVLTLGSVQSAAFAANVIARDAARIHATETDPSRAQDRVAEHTSAVLADYGLTGADVVTVSCSADPCASPGGTVTAQVRIPVPVPGLGPLFDDTGPVAVGAQHQVPVDQYRTPIPSAANPSMVPS
jgi:Flp pilus assembly protein TadG